ncbi:MAG: type II toxin-antitoxin system RelE/ParE family toxin [Alphaproteobacteria bacterium]|nr:type II toxin-antitoxin system RelE/ParE family toxin [Alphaproteobacteria bacterium]
MRVFCTRPFARFADREGLTDPDLCEAIRRIQRGLVDADLGGGVIKQRIGRRGQGRSGGFRTIVLFRRGEFAFFVYGFAKNARDNLRRDELRAFRKLADEMLVLDESGIEAALTNRTVIEVNCDG